MADAFEVPQELIGEKPTVLNQLEAVAQLVGRAVHEGRHFQRRPDGVEGLLNQSPVDRLGFPRRDWSALGRTHLFAMRAELIRRRREA